MALLQHDVIHKIAAKYNKGPGHVLLRYQVDRGIICLTKSVKEERISSNFNIFDFKLDSEDLKAIDSLNNNVRILPLSWDGLAQVSLFYIFAKNKFRLETSRVIIFKPNPPTVMLAGFRPS